MKEKVVKKITGRDSCHYSDNQNGQAWYQRILFNENRSIMVVFFVIILPKKNRSCIWKFCGFGLFLWILTNAFAIWMS